MAMTDNRSSPPGDRSPSVAGRKPLPPAAQRALAEAEARRAARAARAAEQAANPLPEEHQGPQGPEPTRYGDWERKGIASDF